MSRSYKKFPGYTDSGNHKRFYKKYSNKRTRKNWELDSGGAYKKNHLSYDICDWKNIYFNESDYRYQDWRTGEYITIPMNERYKMRMK